MRYRIIIEIDTEAKREAINSLALTMQDCAVQKWCNPVYLSTEVVTDNAPTILMEKE
jgi:hypothetical protein